MAKIAGFLVQALLVMASFWLNMSHNPKILNGGVFGIDRTVTSSINSDISSAVNRDDASNDEADSNASSVHVDESEPNVTTPQEEKPADESTKGPEFISAGQHYVSAEFAREEDVEIDESVSPKGGKLVSIPSVPVDVLYDTRESDDRFVGVSKSELVRLSKINASKRGNNSIAL